MVSVVGPLTLVVSGEVNHYIVVTKVMFPLYWLSSQCPSTLEVKWKVTLIIAAQWESTLILIVGVEVYPLHCRSVKRHTLMLVFTVKVHSVEVPCYIGGQYGNSLFILVVGIEMPPTLVLQWIKKHPRGAGTFKWVHTSSSERIKSFGEFIGLG